MTCKLSLLNRGEGHVNHGVFRPVEPPARRALLWRVKQAGHIAQLLWCVRGIVSRQPYRAGGQQPFGGAEPPLNEPCGLVGDAKSAEGEVQPFFQQIYPSGSDVRFHVHSGSAP